MRPFGIDVPSGGDLVVLGRSADGELVSRGALGPVLVQVAEELWSGLRGPLQGALRRELGIADRFADGFTLLDLDVHLPSRPRITLQRTTDGQLLVHVVTGRATLVAATTRPPFLCGWAEPRIEIDFAVAFDYQIDVPARAGPLRGSPPTGLRFTEARLDTRGLSADLLRAVTNIVTWLAGTRVDQLLRDAPDALGAAPLHEALAAVNERIRSLADAGHHLMDLHVGDPEDLVRQLGPVPGEVADLPADTQSLVLVCREPGATGVVDGHLSWPEGTGGPVHRSAFALMAPLVVGRLPPTAVARLRAVVQRDPVDVIVSDASALESQRLSVAVSRFALAPVAAGDDLDCLAGSPGVRIWDAGSQGELSGPRAPGVAAGSGPTDPVAPSRPAPAPLPVPLRPVLAGHYAAVMDAFRLGPAPFTVDCAAGPDGDARGTGQLVGMWEARTPGRQGLRYRIEGVQAAGGRLAVGCRLAPGWTWHPGPPPPVERWECTARMTGTGDVDLRDPVVVDLADRRSTVGVDLHLPS